MIVAKVASAEFACKCFDRRTFERHRDFSTPGATLKEAASIPTKQVVGPRCIFKVAPSKRCWRAALAPIGRKKIGDAWGITGKAYVDRTTAALRLLEYQGVGKERE